MNVSMNNLFNNYAYGSPKTVKPKLDKDNDGQWNLNELKNYTKAYEKATGNKLDAEKLMSQYDADKDGKLNAAEQKEVNKADALGLQALSKKQAVKTPDANEGLSISEKLADLMKSMSSGTKASLTNVVRRSEQMGQMLQMFGGGSSSANSFAGILAQQNAAKMYSAQMRNGYDGNFSALANQLMNFSV